MLLCGVGGNIGVVDRERERRSNEVVEARKKMDSRGYGV